MKQYQIISRPRHLRYIYFVDENYSYANLFNLINANQVIWGGRYNPIIPIRNNTISENYISLLKNYDPDYIFYSDGVNSEIIKRLGVFNPCEYLKLDENHINYDIQGLNTWYLISKLDKRTKIILTQGLYQLNSLLLDFYKLNFGIEKDSLLYEFEVSKSCSQIIVDKQNFNSLNQIIYENRTIIKSGLSRKDTDYEKLRSFHKTFYNDFEIVIAKDKSSTLDLLYYWNRLLYEGLNVFYLTIEELNSLSNDKFFGLILSSLSYEKIDVVSNTLTEEELNQVVTNNLKNIVQNRTFRFKDIKDFPYEISEIERVFFVDFMKKSSTQTLISNSGLFFLPKIDFVNQMTSNKQNWVVDIKIKEVNKNDYKNDILFPLTTSTQNIVNYVQGRINKNRNISIYIDTEIYNKNNLNINVPNIKSIFNQLISLPVIDGKTFHTKYIRVGLNDSSNRLSAFIKSFNSDFHTIEDFFTDFFWVSLFEELIISQKICGDSISFEEIKSKYIDIIKNNIELGTKEDTNYNEKDIILSLKEKLNELCYYRVFLKGFNLKCPHCSSKFWYTINSVNEDMVCYGCIENFRLPIEPSFAYKLNDLVKNNIFQSSKCRDGNLTVIRTLALIFDESRKSFDYMPQINLYNNFNTNRAYSDVDIFCISDGKLIIGEAKHNSKEFSADKNKSLISLSELAKHIRPDVVILSCYEDSNGKLNKAKQGLLHYFNGWNYMPEIKTYLLPSPNHISLSGSRYFYC